MFLVGGGILVHGVPSLHHLAQAAAAFTPGWLWENLFNAAVGIAAGALIVGAEMLLRRLRGKPAAAH
jgi:predicted DNA repair protein MutK